MRDYVIVGVILACLPVGLVAPYYGMLVYTWLSYMYPYTYAWGFAQTFPMARLTALSAIAGTILTRKVDFAPLRQRELVLMLLLGSVYTLSSAFAFYPQQAWNQWQEVAKLFVMGVLTAILLTDHQRIRYFLLLVALSLGFYGLKGGIFAILTRGQNLVWGPDNSILAGNNAIGLALNMCLPLLWYLAREERGWLKRLLQLMFFLSIPAILFSYARASALTLPIVLVPLMLRGRGRFFLVIVVLLGGILATPYIPDRWWKRQQTVLSYEEDASAMSRIDNWKFCWKLVMDRPLTGGGFQFNERATFAKYSPEFLTRYGGKTWNSHSIYFSMLATHGFPGFFLFVGMILSCLLSCRQMAKLVKGRPDLKWIDSYCSIVKVSFLAFLVNGAFVNMEYFDLPYHLVAVVASLKVLCRRAVAEVDARELTFDRSLVTAV
jgi:putative inorganic carbon (hco3(-)) transporter